MILMQSIIAKEVEGINSDDDSTALNEYEVEQVISINLINAI